jgi:predicted RNase H-related nuclease YkuK (DUF458 family)
MSEWFSGSGERVPFEDILTFVEQHSSRNGIVYVGCDSFLQKRVCIFSTAICLCNADGQAGGRYFIKKTKFRSDYFVSLLQRITAEVQDSISVGTRLLAHDPQTKIELHLDVSGPEKDNKTSRFADMMVGYVKGSGFACKIKPLAFAASSVADKHSK